MPTPRINKNLMSSTPSSDDSHTALNYMPSMTKNRQCQTSADVPFLCHLSFLSRPAKY